MTPEPSSDTAPNEALGAAFDPYAMAAAGLARERGDAQAAAILGRRTRLDARFGDVPITITDGRTRAVVEVVLHVDEGPAERERETVAVRLAELLDETAAADGYHVAGVRIDVDR